MNLVIYRHDGSKPAGSETGYGLHCKHHVIGSFFTVFKAKLFLQLFKDKRTFSDMAGRAVTYLDNVFALTVKGEILVEGGNGICLRLGYPDLFRNIGKQLGRDIA